MTGLNYFKKAIDSVSFPVNLNLKYCFLGKWQQFFICFLIFYRNYDSVF